LRALRRLHADSQVLEGCPTATMGDPRAHPLPTWSEGRVVLRATLPSDDAHMAQGAATSIEDAAVLARCLEAVEGDDIEAPSSAMKAHRSRASRASRRSPAPTPG